MYEKLINSPKEFKIFIDNSISMQDGVKYKNEIISAFNLAEKYASEVKKLSKIPVIIKTAGENTELYSYKSKPNFNRFNYNIVFDETIDVSTYSSIILTDGNNPVEKITYNEQIPVYIILPDANKQDAYIKKAELDNGNLKISIVNNTDTNTGSINVLNNNIKIFETTLKLKKGENNLIYTLDKRKINEKALTINLIINARETNLLNNKFYVRSQREEEKRPIYLFFSRPSFDTRFLIRSLSITNKYNLNIKIPKPGEKLIFPKIPNNAIVFAGDFIVENLVNIENLYSFIKNGGTLIYLNRNTKLDNNLPASLNNILPFTPSNTLQSTDQNPLIPTDEGLKMTYINFRDRSEAKSIWKSFANHKLPDLMVNPKPGAKILLTKGNSPAIIKQNIEKGTVIAVLFYPLWPLDFQSVGFGTISNYFDIFITELIESSMEIPKTLIYIAEPVKELREQVELIAHPSISQDILNKKITVILKSKENIIPVHFFGEAGVTKSKVFLNSPGIWEVYISNKAEPVNKIFINYPQNELTTGTFEKNLSNITENNPNITLKTFNEIKEIVKNAKREVISHSVTESIAITSFFIYALIALGIILLAWYFKSDI